jgi:hypothetical protein
VDELLAVPEPPDDADWRHELDTSQGRIPIRCRRVLVESQSGRSATFQPWALRHLEGHALQDAGRSEGGV